MIVEQGVHHADRHGADPGEGLDGGEVPGPLYPAWRLVVSVEEDETLH